MNAPLTRIEAEDRTGLTSRAGTSTNDRYAFLSCQLGRVTRETRPNPRNGMPMNVDIFQLVGFGCSWDRATRRARKSANYPVFAR